MPPLRNPVAAVLFDMDGVLVDNMRFHQAAWVVYAREALNIELDPEAPKHFHGRNGEIVERLTGRPLSADEALRHHEGKEACYRDLARGRMRPVAGLLDYLQWLDERRIARALVTNSDALCMDFVLGELGLAGRFTTTINGDDVTHAKPHPEPYLTAAARLGVAPARCLVHEDTAGGIRAGLAAGAIVAGIATSLPAEALLDAGASFAVPDFLVWRGVVDGHARESMAARLCTA